ncbi:hypothetical protein Scep_016250 [Stephania cephalantha]|uniref:Zinc finger PHD-type domain-containing protein n=1 Tax=Stephania cephalantha TaxID=152367 RepID=A0AAP0IP73_9MAGN
MSQLNLTGCKRRKRGGRVFGFKNFCEPGHPIEFNGPFHDNIKKLLAFATLETKLGGGMRSWSFQLEFHQQNPVQISLFVIEESAESSLSYRCRYCQYVGWGHHMICNEKFHLVLPSNETALVMAVCSDYEVNGRISDASSAMEKPNFIELQGHLLHGVLHSNGFGHLLCVNGIENGSELAGNEIIDFWDRICTRLRARKVSVIDVAKKRNMDLRLIHGIAFGEPWFGRWGYRFARGSFGVTEQMYLKAMDGLQSLPLCLLIQQFSVSDIEVLVIFDRYQAISNNSLLTLGHLLRFMHELKHCLPPETRCSIKPIDSRAVVETNCRWSQKRVEMAIRVIVEALKRAKFRWISRQEVRDAARIYIGDTGLLDFVLKSLGNHVVGNYIVRRTVNPVTKVLEYCLEDLSSNREDYVLSSKTKQGCHQVTRFQLRTDMYYLYKYIFKEPRLVLNTGIFSAISMATRVILDSKHLIKDYRGEYSPNPDAAPEEKMNLLCTILLIQKGESNIVNQSVLLNKKALLPYASIVLPTHATIRELKIEVEKNFREMYWGLKTLVVESIVDVNAADSDMVFGLVEASSELVLAGRTADVETDIEGMYERSKDSGVIDCSCGTKEDDGERMIACDICDVQQHHRCAMVSSNEDVPHIFLCSRCEHDILFFRFLP